MDIWTMPLTLQVGLGGGYLAYLIAYSGERRGHSAMDATFMSFAMGIPAMLPLTMGMPPAPAILLGVAVSLLIAILWRQSGRLAWHWLARRLGLGQDDGRQYGWDAIVNRRGLTSSQISVHTADGRVLYLNDRRRFSQAPFEGLYLGSDGSVLMAVEEEELPNGVTETREGVSDADWGTRLTFIPADQITRVNIRF